MLQETLSCRVVAYHNFNLCPHCERLGLDPLLLRLAEGLPMISRSDGENFHVLLADRPLPYPAERAAGPSRNISLCFWYSSRPQKHATRSAIILAPVAREDGQGTYRTIEFIADLLSEKLLHESRIAGMYKLTGDSLLELSY